MRRATNLGQNEKGITLIELLAVIVILGIIAAIAVPAIGNMIENSKKDAIVANARNMLEATRLLSVAENNIRPSEGHMTFVPLGHLVKYGYMEKFNNHGSQEYAQGGEMNKETNVNQPIVSHHDWTNAETTYVVIRNENGTLKYFVRIMLENKLEVLPYVEEKEISRDKVKLHFY